MSDLALDLFRPLTERFRQLASDLLQLFGEFSLSLLAELGSLVRGMFELFETLGELTAVCVQLLELMMDLTNGVFAWFVIRVGRLGLVTVTVLVPPVVQVGSADWAGTDTASHDALTALNSVQLPG